PFSSVGTRPQGIVRLATRRSPLALAQARTVLDALQAASPGLDVVVEGVVTEGDRQRTVPTPEIGGEGGFTAAVQQAVLDGAADLAVHSAKDLPAVGVDGLILAAVPPRADPRDALVSRDALHALDELPFGAVIGTGSPRRAALLRWQRPDLQVQHIRG